MKSCDPQIDWEREYEDLRREALQTSSRRGHGLALFLSRGMMAWLEALAALESRPLMQRTPQESVDFTSVLRPDLTTLLANMVLSCMGREEAYEQLQ